MNNKIQITVVIPVKNEEKNLHYCLEQLSEFAQIIVVDSDSTDNTPNIVKQFGAKYLNFNWNGSYPKKRNWVLLNHEFKTLWVLFLDADEFVNKNFCDQIRIAITDDQVNGFWLNYSNYFLGKELKHGLPQRKLALFKIGSGLYERIDETSWSTLDMEIHEHPIIEGAIGEISQKIEHNDFRGMGKFITRHLEYAKWEAKRVLLLEQQGELQKNLLTRRQYFKYKNIKKWWFPWFYFSYTYFIKLGFLDGAAGLYYAFYKAWYFLTIKSLAVSD